jgi:spore coat protein A
MKVYFTKRKGFPVFLGFALALLVSGFGAGAAQAQQGTPLPGSAIPQFIDPLPDLQVLAGTSLELHSKEFQAPVMPTGFTPATGTYDGTWVWGYLPPGQTSRNSYIGPVILANRGTTTQVKWVNDLGYVSGTHVLAYKYSTDQTLHWADPFGEMCMALTVAGQAPTDVCAEHYDGSIPDVTHLHGGEVPPQIDGGPDAWYTSDGGYHGAAYHAGPGGGTNSTVFRYPNSQEAAAIWFHPHPLGVTRLNVYAGLAGAYLLTDLSLNLPTNLPGPADIVPLVIQDRMFDTNGQLYFPNIGINPEHPFWIPEFVGDTIVVNGKVWPYKDVEQKRYRFFFLNGSNARTYEMFLVDPVTKAFGPPMWVIATGGGYLDDPVKLDPALGQKLVIMPGERYEVIIDFADTTNNPTPSGTYLLRNTGRTPYPKGAPPMGSTLGQIILFRVGAAPAGGDGSYDPKTDGALRTGIQRIVRLPGTPGGPAIDYTSGTGNVQKRRQLTLNEVIGPGGPLEILVNNTKWNGKIGGTGDPIDGSDPDGFGNYVTETPTEGQTEVWEIINLTADAHPIHLHLVQFQLINRQNYNVNKYSKAYDAAFSGKVYLPAFGPPNNYDTPNGDSAVGGNPAITAYLQGMPQLPLLHEQGWKDTTVMYPGQVTRIAVRWAPQDLPNTTAPADAYFDFDPSGSDYVWHCHILDHEDNEMMRPTKVTVNTNAPSPRVYTGY